MELLTRIRKYSKKLLFRTVMTALMLSIISVAMPRTEAAASQATLSWNPPTTYTDGSPVTGLGGYKIYTGTAPGNYSQNIDVGNVTSYTLSSLNDATTYYFTVSAYDATGVASDFSNQATFTTPTPPPPANLYTLSASAGSGGSITPSGSVVISQGVSQTYTITPATGYKIAGVTVDGSSVGAVATYSFSNVTANHTISASFTANTSSYSISASTGTGGSISPTGTSTVTSGANQTYTITPATGYKIAGVTVDGTSVGVVASYIFSNVTANHTIFASFIPSSTSTVGFAANSGGSQYVSPTGNTYLADVNYSGGSVSTTTATISGTTEGQLYQSERYGNFSYNVPVANGNYAVTLKFAEIYFSAAGQRVFSVTVNGQTVISNLDIYAMAGNNAAYDVVIPVSVTNGAISINFVSQVNNAKVSAIKVNPANASYTISSSAGIGGSISPAGSSTVTSGGNQAFTITPSTGYKIAGVTVDGSSVGAVSAYSFNNVTANHSISASFAANTSSYSISASAGTGGSISPTGTATVTSGANQTYTITPATGYKIAGVTVDGSSVGAVASYIFSNVTSNHTVSASFTPSSASNVGFAANSGGSQYASSTGTTYLADVNYSGGSVSTTTATISGTTEGQLYQSERYGNFSYNVPVANGNYAVTLKFAEFLYTSTGKRVFSVTINGQTVINSLDIYAKAGKNAAYDVVIPVNVTNGTIKIDFISQVNSAKVSGILVKAM